MSASPEKDSGPSGPAEKRPLWRLVTENIECLAIAIVMALMLKFFLIEAYKIPTGSMQPTIFGNEEQGLFDRVLVNKFIYQVSDPERWDVIVFKYPLDQSKNYIKRLIGLPGEKVTIQGGDIHINDRIERKSEEAITAVLKRIFPAGDEETAFSDFFSIRGKVNILDADAVAFAGPGGARTRVPIRANYLDGYDPDYGIKEPNLNFSNHQRVGDLRIAFRIKLNERQGALRVEIREEGNEHVFFLRGEDFPGESYLATRPVAGDRVWSNPDLFLEAKKAYRVVCSHIDDRLSLRLDGEEIAAYEYDGGRAGSGSQENHIDFSTVGSGADFDDIAVYRDIYYLSGRDRSVPVDFQVPPDHYFALGDNTQNSADSRLWQSAVYTLKDGKILEGSLDQVQQQGFYSSMNARTGDEDGFMFSDVYGDRIFIHWSELASRMYKTRDRNFIPRELMLGKAMVVFWPIYPFFRWKLLR